MDANTPETSLTDSRVPSVQRKPIYVPLVDGHVFRLFHLLPGNSTDHVVIKVFIVEMNFNPAYEALSYVWGSPADLHEIRCNGNPILVTKNLYDALIRLRHVDSLRTLWVDAICINQRHLKERSHQVSFMNLIYKHAERVLAHIGTDPDGGAPDVVSLLNDHRLRVAACPHGEDLPVLNASDPVLSDTRWRAVAFFMDQPWFSRAWVIQEIGLAKNPTAIYGKAAFDYRTFIELIIWMKRCAPSIEARFSVNWLSIHLAWYDWSLPVGHEDECIDMISLASSLRCTDPRDHVYALLGHPMMISANGRPLITPNYEKPAAEVFQDLAEVALSRIGPRWLSFVEHDETTFSSDMPSWVRTWDVEMVVVAFGAFLSEWYQFSGHENEQAIISVRGKHLEVRAVLFDVVRLVFPFWTEDGSSDLPKPAELKPRSNQGDQLPILDRAWAATVDNRLVSCKYGDEGRADAFSLTLCAARTTYRFLPAEDDMEQHRDNFAAYWKLHVNASREGQLRDSIRGNPATGDADQFWIDMRNSSEARCFITTEDGFFGLAPFIARPGDVLCAIPGSKVPFLLRRTRSADPATLSTYRFAGEAFVHGLMRGEIYDMIKRKGLHEETILIE